MKKILVILFGILFIGIGIFVFVSGNELAKRCTTETIGTVVRIEEKVSVDDDGFDEYTYYPVIEYKAGDRTITKESGKGSNPSEYSVNDKIEILYNPNNVEEYIIKGDTSSNVLGIIFAIAGIVVVILGIKSKSI